MNFDAFFTQATGKPEPYDYQRRLAEGACESRLISVPTGLGKTAAVTLAWLWNRVDQGAGRWPRRLVYCLPMRTLVEQTYSECRKWLENHGLLWNGRESHSGKVGLHLLMGGEEAGEWDVYPEENAILIGTQDMLLSRALNRGYGMSRYRWPMHFGLLNNDCLWVMDETQLMGVGVETSAQLDGFRHFGQWLQHSCCPTWWMSATLESGRLATVDHPLPQGGWPRLELAEDDRTKVQHRLEAMKTLQQAPPTLSKVTKDRYASEIARMVLEKHIKDELTLVIVNRVDRAQAIFTALQKAGRKENLALVHSRFRGPDRRMQQDMLIHGNGDRIVIATQAVEAGVDVSARVLITELAPWASLVQRFGRCNRDGGFNVSGGADVHWIDLDFEKDDDAAPYTLADFKMARDELTKLSGSSVSPHALSGIEVAPPAVIRPVIRRKDLVDLFDTTPDIAGHDLDISRYIREGDDTDVQVFWRDLSDSAGEPDEAAGDPARDELCRVAVHRFQAFLKKLNESKDGTKAWLWDGLNERWQPATRARAGAVYLLDQRVGGYSTELGWTGVHAKPSKAAEWIVPLPPVAAETPDATSRDPLTHTGRPLTLEVHTAHVLDELRRVLVGVAPGEIESAVLLTAALWHDVGKALGDFQEMLRAVAGTEAPEGILAKSGKRGGSMPAHRRHFRHELASALVWLAQHDGGPQADLIAYLIAAHHGKVRLSIRSLPEETGDRANPDRLFARGILDGEVLPAVPGYTDAETPLNLGLMKMGADEEGNPSWLARMIAVRDERGPFALAFLEALLRAADMRASAAEGLGLAGEAANSLALVDAASKPST
jgi:CRISPR-associated endonuclease/helicase Cas3